MAPRFTRLGFALAGEQNSSVASSLLYRAQSQDELAWERLNSLILPSVQAWIRKAGISQADSDDIAQQVMMQLHRNLASFERTREGQTFAGWVWTITKFRIRDFFAARKAKLPALGGSQAMQRLHQQPDPQWESTVYDAESTAVAMTQRAIESLKSEFTHSTWDAFWRAAVLGDKPAVIAEEMGLSVAAVYKAKSRVMKRVRDELKDIVSIPEEDVS